MSFEAFSIGSIIGTIGALGAASFALVDTLKILPNGGISNVGFVCVEHALQGFFPNQTRHNAGGGVKRLFDELHGNWVGGRPLSDQKAIAKSLIELRLNGATAAQFAQATDMDAALLKTIGEKMTGGVQLTPIEANVFSRFDALLAAVVDDGFQHADQRYQNWTKFAAMLFAITLSVLCGASMSTLDFSHFFGSSDMWLSLIAGLLATPLAPVAKDLASALSSIKIAQALKR
jgi:hypothetical protein